MYSFNSVKGIKKFKKYALKNIFWYNIVRVTNLYGPARKITSFAGNGYKKGGGMKKIAALVVAIAVMLSAAPSFAQGAAAPAKEKNLFKIIANSMKGPHQVKPKNQLRPIEKVNVFQTVADDINKVGKKSK